MGHRAISFGRVVKSGAVNFVRNLSLAIAAMAVMIVTLTIILFALVANTTFNHTVAQITSKINISVYLVDGISTAQKNQLLTELRALPNVASVTYLSKAQALAEFESQNGGGQSLQQAIAQTGNVVPATIHIQPRNLNHLGDIKNFLSKPNIASLQSEPPSYSGQRKQAIDNISRATDDLRIVGIIAVIVFAVISALIIFNTIQMAIFNRRDEIRTMRLLGASTGFIRGPFVVESVIYGIVSALISTGLIWAIFEGASQTLQASSLGVLDINYSRSYFNSHWPLLLLIQLALGILIGAVSSVLATRRYLKFKTTK